MAVSETWSQNVPARLQFATVLWVAFPCLFSFAYSGFVYMFFISYPVCCCCYPKFCFRAGPQFGIYFHFDSVQNTSHFTSNYQFLETRKFPNSRFRFLWTISAIDFWLNSTAVREHMCKTWGILYFLKLDFWLRPRFVLVAILLVRCLLTSVRSAWGVCSGLWPLSWLSVHLFYQLLGWAIKISASILVLPISL